MPRGCPITSDAPDGIPTQPYCRADTGPPWLHFSCANYYESFSVALAYKLGLGEV